MIDVRDVVEVKSNCALAFSVNKETQLGDVFVQVACVDKISIRQVVFLSMRISL